MLIERYPLTLFRLGFFCPSEMGVGGGVDASKEFPLITFLQLKPLKRYFDNSQFILNLEGNYMKIYDVRITSLLSTIIGCYMTSQLHRYCHHKIAVN